MVPTAVSGEWHTTLSPQHPAALLVPSLVTAATASASCQSLLLCPW